MATYFKTFWKPWMTLNAPPNLWLLFQAKMNDKSWSKPIIENFLNVMNVCEVDIRGKAHDPGILSCPPLQGFCNVLKYSTELSNNADTKLTQWTCQLRWTYALALMSISISLNTSGRKRFFLSLFTVTALLCGALLWKTPKSQVWRSSIVAHSKELFRRDFRRD